MCRDILAHNLLQNALDLRLWQKFFQQDSDPKHVSQDVKGVALGISVNDLECAIKNPDLTPSLVFICNTFARI